MVTTSARVNREHGQTLVEYALILGFISMATITAMVAMGPAIGDGFQAVTDILTGFSF